MQITTSRGNTYSYSPLDNSIVEGEYDCVTPFHISFKPLEQITNLPAISSYTIGVTEQCNMRCSYCCYSGKYPEHRTHSTTKLTSEAIPAIIELINDTATSEQISIEFYGGESLIELKWIKEFVSKADNAIHGRKIKYELSTNGLLLSQQTADWLVENNFTLFVSVDGTRLHHDRYRKDISGRGTFGTIGKNLEYIKAEYPEYWCSNINLMMTIPQIESLCEISSEWEKSPLLHDKQPLRISGVATIYNSECKKIDYETEKEKYLQIVRFFISHPEQKLIATFFNSWLSEWIDRPIFTLTDTIEYPTCIPHNKKLFIDAKGLVGICENSSDTIRIGSIGNGLEFDKVNNVVERTANIIASRCKECTVARVCDICPDVLRLSPDELDVYCHNKRANQQIKFRCFCELAEEGLI